MLPQKWYSLKLIEVWTFLDWSSLKVATWHVAAQLSLPGRNWYLNFTTSLLAEFETHPSLSQTDHGQLVTIFSHCRSIDFLLGNLSENQEKLRRCILGKGLIRREAAGGLRKCKDFEERRTFGWSSKCPSLPANCFSIEWKDGRKRVY